MTEQLLHRANVVPVLEQGGREAVARGVPAEYHGQPLKRARSDNRWNRADLDREHVFVEKIAPR